MPHSLFSTLAPADASWALLQADGRTTRYLRMGRGSGVLLLLQEASGDASGEVSGEASGLWPVITTHLAASHRVLVPEFTGPASELGLWLSGFLDGIGSAPVAIVAADDLCVPALQVALLEPERVTALVLVPPPLTGEAPGVRELSAPAAGTRTPVLLLDAGMPRSAMLRALDEFLSGNPPGAAAAERARA